MMRSKELRALGLQELQEKLAEAVREHYELRVRNTTKELENTSKLRLQRRYIARLKQAIDEKRAAAPAK
ncbi:MAG: 50S ribosomal protein L29 [Candidatus Sumerlaeaceae bacterium]|nr:50S ribosomal protein L29 [Candidatus Sumerlaeaceae bacterium]